MIVHRTSEWNLCGKPVLILTQKGNREGKNPLMVGKVLRHPKVTRAFSPLRGKVEATFIPYFKTIRGRISHVARPPPSPFSS